MGDSWNTSEAVGYKEASKSAQKVDGKDFIQTDVLPKAGDVILDLGCGTGELSACLAELVGPEGKVIGVDPDKERIQLAMETHSQIENLSFVEGSASSFPGIGSGSYDIIFSNFALHWMTNKQQVLNNMFEGLKAGGKIAFQYVFCLPPFVFNACKEMNPENAERICQKFQCESKSKIDKYCKSAGFRITKSFKNHSKGLVFGNVERLLKWHWSTNHGLFDLSLVTEERLQRYLAAYRRNDGTLCLDFREKEDELHICRLIAFKQ